MSQTRRDFWPDEIAVTSVVTPIAILKEQAALLGEKTKGLVLGEVESEQEQGEEVVEDYLKEPLGSSAPIIQKHTLYLVTPALDNYQYSLLSVKHDFELYPCEVCYHPKPEDLQISRDEFDDSTDFNPRSEDEFVEWLEQALSQRETRRIIRALIERAQNLEKA